jgi:DNA polymerase-3 subunit gamma/tau
MAYTVLARRYRSTSFGGVVGQEAIAQTLRNAIAHNRVAHAYLFTGTRGVGKTSMARIFARALNAPDTIEDAPKLGEAAATPPGAVTPGSATSAAVSDYPPLDVQQRMAEAIMRGDDINVIEIDAASNRGVDEARSLIAGAVLSPTANARFKVYIVDEVHMLTPPAFNTLLKTMEEPPAHVKFILCTTEAHKIPATIQSRCQRFDFRNIPVARIAEHLRHVLHSERINADDEVVFQVARLANGSMRDGLSLLDRLIAAGTDGGGGRLTRTTLEQMFGLPDSELIAGLVDALADGDIAASLERTADLLNRGISQDQFVEVLTDRLRQLMLLAACGADSPLVELSEDARPRAIEQAARFDAPGITYMIALLDSLGRASRVSATPRALLDAAVVRLALAEKMADVAALLAGGTVTPRVAGQKKKPAMTTR